MEYIDYYSSNTIKYELEIKSKFYYASCTLGDELAYYPIVIFSAFGIQ